MTDTFGFVQAVKPPSQKLRRRMGKVITVGTDYTLTVQIAGDTTNNIAGVRYFGHFAPKAGSQVWLDTDGVDVIAVGAVAGLGGVVPVCRVYRSTDLNVASSTTYTTVAWASSLYDTHNMWTSGTDVVAPITGTYLVQATYSFANLLGGYRSARIVSGSTTQAFSQYDSASSIAAPFTSLGTVCSVAKGTAFTLEVRQTSGSTLALNGGVPSYTNLFVTYLGADS